MKKTVYSKLVLTYVALTLFIGSILIPLGYQMTKDYYQEITQKLNTNIAMYMASNYNLADNPSMLTNIATQAMILNPAIEIYLLDTAGKIIQHTQNPKSIKRYLVDTAPIKTFLSADSHFPIRGTDPKSRSASKVFSVAPLNNSNNRLSGYVYVVLGGQLFANIAANISASYVVKTGLIIAVLVVLSTLVLGIFAFKMLTARLKRLTAGIQNFDLENATTSNHFLNLRPQNDELDLLHNNFVNMTAKIQQQLHSIQQSNTQRRELISNVSHDLRTPLATCQGYIETLALKNSQLNAQARLDYLTVAQRSCEKLSTLIDNLFELSKLEAGQIDLKCERFSLLELIYDTVQEFDIQAHQKNITIHVPAPSKNIRVHADIALIQRVFANLIGNALKFTPANGSISIDLQIDSTHINVIVTDTGEGIKPQDIPHIFERHYYVNSAEAAQKSSGLGLSIVKKILELHNSTILVNSVLNSGSQFRFALPVT